MSDWGKGAENNNIGWGQGVVNNAIGWGSIYSTSESGDTILVPGNVFADAFTAFSLRDLGIGATNVVRVRRSSDNTEQDFTANEVTNGTLTSFCGVGDGFVTIWYDQAGSNNAVQTVLLEQPQIVNAGSLILENGKPTIDFLGDLEATLSTSIFTTISQPVVRIAVAKNIRGYICDGNQRGVLGVVSINNYRIFAGTVDDYNLTAPDNQKLWYGVFDTQSELFINNVSLGTKSVGTDGLNQIYLGGHVSGLEPTITRFNGNIQEFIAYGSNVSSIKNDIHANINNYYSIY